MLEVKIGSASFSLSLPDWMTATSDSWLSDHQVLVGGLIGFTGVCVSVFSTAWLQSRARKSEAALRQATARVAFIAELEMLSSKLENLQHYLEEGIARSGDTAKFFSMSKITMTMFHEMKDQMVLLTIPEIKLVVGAYDSLFILDRGLSFESKGEPNDLYYTFDVDDFDGALEACKTVKEIISSSVDELRRNV